MCLFAGKFSKIRLLKKDTISSPLDFRHTLTVRPNDEASVKQLVAVAKDTPPGSPAIMRAIACQYLRLLTFQLPSVIELFSKFLYILSRADVVSVISRSFDNLTG